MLGFVDAGRHVEAEIAQAARGDGDHERGHARSPGCEICDPVTDEVGPGQVIHALQRTDPLRGRADERAP